MMLSYIKLYDERKGFLKQVGCLIDAELVDTCSTDDNNNGTKNYAIVRDGKTIGVLCGNYNLKAQCFYIGIKEE